MHYFDYYDEPFKDHTIKNDDSQPADDRAIKCLCDPAE